MAENQNNAKIVVLLTCHNRMEQTLGCLKALFAQTLPKDCLLDVILVDDGSTDGTSDAVNESFPMVKVLSGNGSLFWNGGMRLAFDEALKGAYDFYLWLNDDTLLADGVLTAMLQVSDEVGKTTGTESIVAGTTRSSADGRPTYGGVKRLSRLRRTRFSLVPPTSRLQDCETMNGNCVLIPREVAEKVGNLDASFVHGMGDFDYGLRARALGFEILVMPGFAGVCNKNPQTGNFSDNSLPLRDRWRRIRSTKGLPLREWCIFCRRHAGVMWWIFFVWPYVRLFLSSLLPRRSSAMDERS
jgi:GT2 family glycosyltransferase